ncbi:MAG: GreA/GreB family elongation factor [Methylibium sp.]|uniref:GreA/GreB family elongation factor n=1 Tax=Methylibium sp. TaxID=2067992 RepID=UPI0017CC2D7E|nr:GreA/GreB family elongation factor [Methylibium sp.]MBA3597379.1 GreA/GreB family elongation factor [Methylibium sp.]
MEISTAERTFTELDQVRLTTLIHKHDRGGPASPQTERIAQALDMADIVPSRQVPPDVVTMYSQVLLLDLTTGQRSKLTVCYPQDSEPAAGLVSVLSPVDSGLLGLKVGSVSRWHMPTGAERAAQVLEILFQPEASGDYLM